MSDQPPPFSPDDDAPLQLPNGFWAALDHLLRHPEQLLASLTRDEDSPALMRLFLKITLVLGAIYGAAMGATNLLQGSVMATHHKVGMIPLTAFKVPLLFC